MIYYTLIIAAALLFSLQFLFQQSFQRKNGNSWAAALDFSVYSALAAFFIMLIIGRFRLSFSWFAFAVAFVYASVGILYNYAGIRAFESANLSVFSMFAMLGGMLLPSAFGILFYHETLTCLNLIGCALILFSLLLTIRPGQGASSGLFFCVAVFILNGMSGVLSKLHQSNPAQCVDSISFMALTRLLTLAICLPLKHWSDPPDRKRQPALNHSILICSTGYALFFGIGNLFTLISLKNLAVSVQYPMITCSVIVFSALIRLLRHEKLTTREVFSAVLAFAAALMM